MPGRARAWSDYGTTGAARAVRVGDRGRRLDALAQNLAHLSPAAVLERGYAIVTRGNGDIVIDGTSLATGEDVAIAFARGTRGDREIGPT